MFHVPEKYRVRSGPMGSTTGHCNNGVFVIPPVTRRGLGTNDPIHRALTIIASDGLDWEHVSAHAFSGWDSKTYTPYWDEMQFVKNLFWDEEDVVIQIHPSKSNYVNVHPNVLHLWRPVGGWGDSLPLPPLITV